ncbi:MAG: hypothetical protein ABI629_05025 [bacterium]
MSSPTDPNEGTSGVDCPAGPFETDLATIRAAAPRHPPDVQDQQTADFDVPIEISRITDGGVSFFRGGLMNEGATTWYAFDAGRQLLVAVLATAGDRATSVPSSEKLSPTQLVRYTTAAGHRRAEFVTVAVASPAHVRQFACLANSLLHSLPADACRPLPADAIAKRFSLLHAGQTIYTSGGKPSVPIEGEIERCIKQPLQGQILSAL